MADTLKIELKGIPQAKGAIAEAIRGAMGAVHQANVATAIDIDRHAKQNLTQLVYTRVAKTEGGTESSVFGSSRHRLTGRLRASYHVEVGENRAHGVRWQKPFFDAPASTSYTDDRGQTYDGSLNVEIPAGGAVVGSNVEYAPFVEFGTSKMEARPAVHMATAEAESRHIQRIQRIVKGAVE